MRIGIDLGGTNIAGGLVDEATNCIVQKSIPTLAHRSTEAVVGDILTVITELMAEAEAMGHPVEAIGIGVPGLVDSKGEVVLKLTNLEWEDVPLKDLIQAKVNLPVFIENDANAAVFAEWHSGSLKGAEVGILLTLGTGLGGGLILNQKIYRGQRGLGELGHMVIHKGGRPCGCGLKGCLEAYSSATGLVRTAKVQLEADAGPSALRSIDPLTPRAVMDAAKAGDRLAEMAVKCYVEDLAIGINNLINTLDPSMIAIGGGLAHAGDYLLDAIRAEVRKLAFDSSLVETPIVFAHYLNDAGIIGAALMTYQ